MPVNEAFVSQLKEELTGLPWAERLAAVPRLWPELRVAFSTSFSFEDQVITEVIAKNKLPIRIFTLDTGRLFEEIHTVHQETRSKYGLGIETYFPDAKAVESFVARNGINGFYQSVENRKGCCYIRKVEPLERALKGTDIWVSGLRHEHSETRDALPIAEWDAAHGVAKFYPLIDVGGDELWAYIKANSIPYNVLHDKGFPSIGCAPCTRAIMPGEPMRAGRWWWENADAQECGLHVVDGKLVRVTKEEAKGIHA
jgi:phosphoadenosine phosphosulfate reductase